MIPIRLWVLWAALWCVALGGCATVGPIPPGGVDTSPERLVAACEEYAAALDVAELRAQIDPLDAAEVEAISAVMGQIGPLCREIPPAVSRITVLRVETGAVQILAALR